MSPSQDPEAEALADLIDDTDGRAVQADVDLEPTSAIPAEAAATGGDSDISDPELADIMADGDSQESPAETDTEPALAPESQPSEVAADSGSGDEEQAFRSQLIGLVAPDDTEQIILLRRALVAGRKDGLRLGVNGLRSLSTTPGRTFPRNGTGGRHDLELETRSIRLVGR